MKSFSKFITELKDFFTEAPESAVTFTFGRFNPPTQGHEKLILKVQDVAKDKK